MPLKRIGRPPKYPRIGGKGPVRRQWQILYAEQLIAQQLDDAEVDRLLVEHFKVSESVAARRRTDAWQNIMSVVESNRPDRFKQVVHALRHLYATAFKQGKLSVCAQVLHQMREMFDLVDPYIEGGGKETDKHERTTEELSHFAMTGEWPEETEKRKASEPVKSTNPLDELV